MISSEICCISCSRVFANAIISLESNSPANAVGLRKARTDSEDPVSRNTRKRAGMKTPERRSAAMILLQLSRLQNSTIL